MSLPSGPIVTGPELLGSFFADPFKFLRACHKEFGDIFTIKLGTFGVTDYNASGDWVFLSRPDHLKALFKADSATILAGAANDILFQQLFPAGSSALLDGKAHIDRRRLIGQLVQRDQTIHSYGEPIYQSTLNEITNFPSQQVFSLGPIFRRIAADAMRQLVFGSINDDRIKSCVNRVSDFFRVDISHDEKRNVMSDCNSVLSDMISEHKKCPHAHTKNDSAFNFLMTEVEKGNNVINETSAQAEMLTMLVGGGDTTGSKMSWIMAWILSHTDVLARIKDELDQTLGNKTPQAEDYEKLVYLEAVIIEACRISPMLFNSSARLLAKPMQFDDYELPIGTILASCVYIAHTREDNYSNPFQFDPNRFLNNKPDPFKWVPFGGGIRRCIGMAFAMFEMKVVIATLLQHCNFEPVNLSTEPELQGSFFAPKGGVPVRLV